MFAQKNVIADFLLLDTSIAEAARPACYYYLLASGGVGGPQGGPASLLPSLPATG